MMGNLRRPSLAEAGRNLFIFIYNMFQAVNNSSVNAETSVAVGQGMPKRLQAFSYTVNQVSWCNPLRDTCVVTPVFPHLPPNPLRSSSCGNSHMCYPPHEPEARPLVQPAGSRPCIHIAQSWELGLMQATQIQCSAYTLIWLVSQWTHKVIGFIVGERTEKDGNSKHNCSERDWMGTPTRLG